MKHFNHRSAVLSLSAAAVTTLALFAWASTVEARFIVRPSPVTALTNDQRISSVVASAGSTTAGATTTWTAQFTTTAQITAPGGGLRIDSRGSCGTPEPCRLNFSGANFSGMTAQFSVDPSGGVNIEPTTSLAAGTYTVTMTNVTNPNASGGIKLAMQSRNPGDPPPQEGQPSPETLSNFVFVGSIAVYGKAVAPDGSTPVANAGANVRNENFSFNAFGGADQNGDFLIPAPQGMTSGQYFVELFAPGGQSGYVSPDPVAFTYSGAAVNVGNVAFRQATKTLNVTVRYQNGNPVTTASIWTNRQGGGFGGGADVNASGVATILLAGGTYDVGIGPQWDQENQRQRAVDWTYNAPPSAVSFANNTTAETQSMTFTVTQTDASIRGRILKPDGTAATNLNVNCNSGFGGGSGSQTDTSGNFTIPIVAGEYRCDIWLDPSNTAYAQLAAPEMRASVASGQAFDFGSVTLTRKEGVIAGRVTLANGTAVPDYEMNAWIEGPGGGGWNSARTDASGNYTMYVRAPGTFNVEPNRGNTSYVYSGPPQRVQLVAANSRETVNFTVAQPNASILVTTVDANGAALSNVWGYAECSKVNAPPGPENQSGNGLNRGSTTISLVLTGTTEFSCGTFMGPESGLLLQSRKNVTIAIGETKSVQLTLVAPDATINITVVDQDNNRVTNVGEGIEIFASQFKEGGDMFGQGNMMPARLGNDGTSQVRVRGGQTYNLGYWVRPDGPAAGMYLSSPPKPAPFEVPANGTVSRTLTVFKANTSVSGRLLDPNGNPTAGFVFCGNWRFMENKVKGDFEGGKIIDTGVEVRNGTFTVPLVAGTKYDCGASVPHFLKSGSLDMPPDMTEVNPTKTAPVSGLTLQFTRADHTMTITAARQDGGSMPFGWCHAWREQGGFSGGEIMGGTGQIPLKSGTWFVGCDSHDPSTGKFWRSNEEEVTVTAGTSSKTLTLRESFFQIPESTSATFDCTQAQTLSLGDGTSLAIPANALATEGNCTVTATPDINLYSDADDRPIMYGYDFTASQSGQTITGNFNSAVTLSIQAPTDEQLSDLGVSEEDIIPKVFDETNTAWQDVDGSSYDSENNLWSVQLNHFTSVSLNTGAATSTTRSAKNIIASPKQGGGPQVTVWDSTGTRTASFMAYATSFRGGVQTISVDLDGDGDREIVTAPYAPSAGHIRVFTESGTNLANLFPYGTAYRGTVSIAAGDVDGDGIDELIVSPRHGGPHVRVYNFDGTAFTLHSSFFAYHRAIRGGIDVAVGDVTGDGTDEIVTSTHQGLAPHVRVLSGTGTKVGEFFPFPRGFRGGVNVSLADMDVDGDLDVISTPRSNGGPLVTVHTGTGTKLSQFFAYASTLRMGLLAKGGDVDGDGAMEIVTAPRNGGPHVKTFTLTGTRETQFMAYASTFRGGLELEVGDLDANGTGEIVVAPHRGAPHVRVLNAAGVKQFDFFSHARAFPNGVNLSLSQ